MPAPQPLPTTVRIGGVAKSKLRSALLAEGVRFNPAAEALFADPRFTTSVTAQLIPIVARSVTELGFPEGATYGDLLSRAQSLGLSECPLELGPHLRLVYLGQADGGPLEAGNRGRAPPEALTIASAPLDADDETPKGFYLRRADGAPWLRGYRSDADHLWSPEDRFVFARAGAPAQQA